MHLRFLFILLFLGSCHKVDDYYVGECTFTYTEVNTGNDVTEVIPISNPDLIEFGCLSFEYYTRQDSLKTNFRDCKCKYY